MDQVNGAMGFLDLLVRPGFCVKDNTIIKVNQPAQCRQIPLGADITNLLLTGKEEYAAFREGCLYLTLELASQPWGASVTRIGEYCIFILEELHEQGELQILALAARELRESLSGIMTTADQLFPASVREDPATAEQIAMLNRGLFRMLRIVGNMSDADLVASASFRQETLDIAGLLHEIFSKAADLTRSAGIQLTYEGFREPLFCLVDREILERGILNILSNAIKFTPSGGTINAKLLRRDNMLYLTIQDSGSGIPENLRSGIYTRYLREPALEDGRYGIGLGMVMIRSAAARHGGTVLIDHPDEQGTRVTMTLAIRQNSGNFLRSPILQVDYAGGRDHSLIELSDCLPLGPYDTKKVN